MHPRVYIETSIPSFYHEVRQEPWVICTRLGDAHGVVRGGYAVTDATLQRVWDSREAISRRCDFDAHKLVKFYQSRQKTEGRRGSRPRATGRGRPALG